MNNFVFGIIAIVSAILAWTLFGKPTNQDSKSADRQEQIEPSKLPSTEQKTPEQKTPEQKTPATETISTDLAQTIPSEIADPWADDSPPPSRTATANLTAPASTSMPPFAAIHDPNRPSTPELQDLSQEILDMGLSKQLRFIPKLGQYANHSDPIIRRYVAYALGQLAAHQPVTPELETVIPILGKLSQDSNPEVRHMAIKALSGIQSAKVRPYLEKQN